MKYAIQDTYWWFDTTDYIDHQSTEWVCGIKFSRLKTPLVWHTEKLSEAKLYNNLKEATAATKIISTPKLTAIVIEVTDKELFEARLKGE